MKFYINGWRESRSYFLSFGFTAEEITAMTDNGIVIERNGNKFWIEVA